MKIIKAMALLVLFAGGVFAAEPYEYWTFDNDAAAKAFGANWENSGVLGSVWNYGGPGTISTDGAGSLVVSNHPGQVYRKLPDAGTANADPSLDQYAEPFTSGVYRLEMDFSSWELDSAAVGSDMTFAALNQNSGTTIAGIRLQVFDSSTARVQLFGDYAGTAAGYRNFEFGLTNAVAVSFAIEFDFDNGTATYSTNGVQTHSFTDFEATQLGQIQFNTDSVWPVTSTVVIDQMGLLGPDTVQPVWAVEFDGSSITNSRYLGGTNFVLDISSPVIDSTDYIGDFSFYAGAQHDISIGDLTNASATLTFAAHVNDTWGHGSVRLQWNGAGTTNLYAEDDVSTAVVMFKKEDFVNGMDTGTIFMHETNDTLTAELEFEPKTPAHLKSGSFRWVVLDDGQYCISSEVQSFTSDSPVVLVSSEATELSWFEYDPTTDVVSVSIAATPELQNIQALGFWMQAVVLQDADGSDYPSFRLYSFSAAASKSAVSPTSLWNDWILGYPGVGANNGLQDHGDSDLLDNLTEYAFGGDPADGGDLGNTPSQAQVVDGGTNYIQYIYFERTDAVDRGLASILEVGTDLVFTNWADGSSYEISSGASGIAGYNAVTNRIPTETEAKQFIRLQVEFTP
jgi:hypothetical protein